MQVCFEAAVKWWLDDRAITSRTDDGVGDAILITTRSTNTSYQPVTMFKIIKIKLLVLDIVAKG
jgi:hypothetical protein